MRYDELREGMYIQAQRRVYRDVYPKGCVEQVKQGRYGLIVCKDNFADNTWNLCSGYADAWEPYTGSAELLLT